MAARELEREPKNERGGDGEGEGEGEGERKKGSFLTFLPHSLPLFYLRDFHEVFDSRSYRLFLENARKCLLHRLFKDPYKLTLRSDQPCCLVLGGGGGVTAIYGLYRYVPL